MVLSFTCTDLPMKTLDQNQFFATVSNIEGFFRYLKKKKCLFFKVHIYKYFQESFPFIIKYSFYRFY